MSIETFTLDQTTGKVVGFRFFDSSGLVFDFSDDTFKPLSSATTTEIVATEGGDVGSSLRRYKADLDLSRLHNAPTVGVFTVSALADSTVVVDREGIRILGGSLASPNPTSESLQLYHETLFRTTEGQGVDVIVGAKRAGQIVDLTGSTCSVTYREAGATTVVLTIDESMPKKTGQPVVNNEVHLTHALPVDPDPTFEGDHLYTATVTVTLPSGEIAVSQFPFPVWP